MHVTCESIGINIHYYRDINETVHVTKASIEITCRVAGMCFEEFLVFFVCAIFFGVKSKESQQLLQGVRVLLWWGSGEESVTKEPFFFEMLGDQLFAK